MNVGNQIKLIAEKRQISLEEIASYLGVTRDAVYKIYKQEHINTERLEQFSKFFNVPIGYFLIDNEELGENHQQETITASPPAKKMTIDYSKIIEDKEKIIRLQEEIIELLKRGQE